MKSRTISLRLVSLWLLAIGLGVAACGAEDTRPPPGAGGSGGIIVLPDGGSGGGGGAGGEGGNGGTGGTENPLSIGDVRPPKGPSAGGTRVTITGKGFLRSVPGEAAGASTTVYFGDNPSIEARVVDDSTIFATTPNGLSGPVDVVIRNASGEAICEGCFHFLREVDLQRVEPSAGPIEGGQDVTLHGLGLTQDLVVTFGGRAALVPRENEDGSLTVTVPSGTAPGPVDVRVFDASGQSFLRNAYAYREALRIHSIEPPGSPLAGGATAKIVGSGLTSTTRIFFGDVEAETVQVEGGLEVSVPPGASVGPIDVEARDSAGSTSFPFAYFDPLADDVALYIVAPRRGTTLGGNEVALVGSGFEASTLAVYFGGEASSEVAVETGNIARALVPPGPTGWVDVRIRSSSREATLRSIYRYVQEIEISSVEPSSGPTTGGTPIAVVGAGFPENPKVFVGGLEATSVVRVDENRIEALTPIGGDGPANVRVMDAADPDNQAVRPDAFVYQGPLDFAVVDPPTGARAGGTKVTLRGKGFRGDMQVRFGENDSPSVVVVNPFTLEVLTPPGNTGPVNVTVDRGDSMREIVAAFAYFNPASSFGGASGGPLGGVLNVTAIAASGEEQGAMLADCTVYVGANDSSRLKKNTDLRGQATFSSPSLVKAVTVTVFCMNYEVATVVNQNSENLTVLLDFNGPIGEGGSGGTPQQERSTISGHVFGFKAPTLRELTTDEEEVAFVSMAYPSVYRAPPLGNPVDSMEVLEEGGAFAFELFGPDRVTFYAIYGIRNRVTDAFEPLLFGMARGNNVLFEEDSSGVEIVLDTRLDLEVPVSILSPPKNDPGKVEVMAFLDLGEDGVIHLSSGFNDLVATETILRALPHVSGESLLFQGVGRGDDELPWTISYRRQAGDLSSGIVLGPMMGPVEVIQPAGRFEGTFEWAMDPSPATPDLIYISVWELPPPTSRDVIPQWHVVVPGDETRVAMPQEVFEFLRDKYSGQVLGVTMITGIHPSFDFGQWSYQNLGLNSFTSYTLDQFGIIP